MPLQVVPLHVSELTRLRPVIGDERTRRLLDGANEARAALSGRTLINVSSTAKGGGVAELLSWIIPYVRGAGVDVSWYVIDGTPEFYTITKRLHNMLHGNEGDRLALTTQDADVYRQNALANADELRALMSPGDIVMLHDPQTAGLAPEVKSARATVIWRCHIGTDRKSELNTTAWEFLRPYLEEVDAYVFSCREHVPQWIDAERVFIIPPSIDPFSTKNRPMSPETARAVLHHVGVVHSDSLSIQPEFKLADDSLARVNRMADIVRTGPAPGSDSRFVVQVSRWDRLKDMSGVMEAFAAHVDGERDTQLVLAGPVVTGVADDPEGGDVLTECIEVWRELPHFERSRIQLICLPMTDVDENAAIVNALHTNATLVIQKSLEEGFGLTVTEAMWKGKPVVASAVGGIRGQIVHGESGLLVQDPTDSREFAAAVQSILDDEQLAARLGTNARARVIDHFLGDRHLLQYAELIRRLG